MKTAIKVIENDFLNYDTVGVVINISMSDEEEIRIYPYQYSARQKSYYIFLRMTDLMKFGMTNEGGTDVFLAPKDVMDTLVSKPFEGWLIDKLERA